MATSRPARGQATPDRSSRDAACGAGGAFLHINEYCVHGTQEAEREGGGEEGQGHIPSLVEAQARIRVQIHAPARMESRLTAKGQPCQMLRISARIWATVSVGRLALVGIHRTGKHHAHQGQDEEYEVDGDAGVFGFLSGLGNKKTTCWPFSGPEKGRDVERLQGLEKLIEGRGRIRTEELAARDSAR